jgi:hypothetical protein
MEGRTVDLAVAPMNGDNAAGEPMHLGLKGDYRVYLTRKNRRLLLNLSKLHLKR